MRAAYTVLAIGLAVAVVVFTQRFIYWICKCIEGRRLIKSMRPSDVRYKANAKLYAHAKIEAVCWVIISIIAYSRFIDCIVQVFRG